MSCALYPPWTHGSRFKINYKFKNMKLHKLKISLLPLLCILIYFLVSLANEIDPRIIGGTEAGLSAWPSAIELLTIDASLWCGGTLITANWVPTAAHRVIGSFPESVAIGRHNLNPHDGEAIGIKTVISHPNFVPNDIGSSSDDITLINLSTPSSWQEATLLVTPASKVKFAESSTNVMTLVGWGITADALFLEILQEVDVDYFRRYVCNQPDWLDEPAPSNQLCVGVEDRGQDSCNGDSGEPIFFWNSSGVATQTGVVSWDEGCTRVRRRIAGRVVSFKVLQRRTSRKNAR